MATIVVFPPTAGPTGQHPDGKIAGDDRGELNVLVDALDGLVRVRYGTPVEWLAMPPDQARAFAAMLIARADSIAPPPTPPDVTKLEHVGGGRVVAVAAVERVARAIHAAWCDRPAVRTHFPRVSSQGADALRDDYERFRAMASAAINAWITSDVTPFELACETAVERCMRLDTDTDSRLVAAVRMALVALVDAPSQETLDALTAALADAEARP